MHKLYNARKRKVTPDADGIKIQYRVLSGLLLL